MIIPQYSPVLDDYQSFRGMCSPALSVSTLYSISFHQTTVLDLPYKMPSWCSQADYDHILPNPYLPAMLHFYDIV